MAPHHSSSDSESSDDEGAPETISLVQSKKDIQKLDAQLKKAEMAERQSKRRQNRELDRKLKERADMNRDGKKKAGELEARMQRAMQEAQEEMDEEGESGSGGGDSDSDSENSDQVDEDVSSLDDDQGSIHSEEAEEEEAEILPQKSKKKTYNPDHLPDELFTAAFASQASASKRKAPEDEEDKPVKQTPKKQKRSHTQKDLMVGSRAIRMLPTPGQPITPYVAPSGKIKKFLNRTLALGGKKQQSKTWERRPANIGVLRRDGPPSNFVRNR